jgi:hypothetical protein
MLSREASFFDLKKFGIKDSVRKEAIRRGSAKRRLSAKK